MGCQIGKFSVHIICLPLSSHSITGNVSSRRCAVTLGKLCLFLYRNIRLALEQGTLMKVTEVTNTYKKVYSMSMFLRSLEENS